MLREIAQQLQNGPITKNGVLPVNTFFFGKLISVVAPLKKRVNLMYQRPNVHIHIFCKRWSSVLGCFFPVKYP